MKLMILAVLSLTVAAGAQERQVFKTVGDRDLEVEINKPEGWSAGDKRPAIVFFYGGGWVGGSIGQFRPHAAYFASRGLVCVQAEYRLLDKKDKEPPVVCIQDARSAMRWVRAHAAELGIDPDRIASAGGSAGGHLAAHCGMVDGGDDPADDLKVSCKPNAMLLFNPVFDNGPDGWGYQRTGDRYQEFSPAHNISADDPPAIVFLGTDDKLIPVATVEKFRDGMKAVGVECEAHFYEGEGHGFFNAGRGDGKAYQDTVEKSDRFLARLGWLEGNPTIE